MAKVFKRGVTVYFHKDVRGKGIRYGNMGDVVKPGNPCSVFVREAGKIVRLNQREASVLSLNQPFYVKGGG